MLEGQPERPLFQATAPVPSSRPIPTERPIKTIIVGNNREYFSPIDVFVPEAVKQEFVESDYDEADMNLMWHGDDKIVILPRAIEPEFTNDIFTLLGYQNTHLIVPHETGAGISEDVIVNTVVFQTVVTALHESPDPQVVAWGHTPQFQHLRESLVQAGASFRTPETPLDRGLWTPDYIDTKEGSRELMERVMNNNPDLGIKIPEGYICDTVDGAFDAAMDFISSGRGVVFKANLGGAGVGINVFTQDSVDTPEKIDHMKIKIRGNELFLTDKIVVEERIDADFSHHGTFPSVDAIVNEDGSVKVLAIDAMVISHKRGDVDFYGCVGGKGLFTAEQRGILHDAAYAVGQDISDLGYRGWYDTDYILAKDGQFSPTEANLRRTSMCYAVDLAQYLYGEDWENEISLRTNDKYIRPNLHGVTYSQLKHSLLDILYPIEGVREGVIITQAMRSKFERGKFGYLIFGDGQDRTKAIEERLETVTAQL